MIRIYHEDRIFNAGELRPEAFAGAEFERCAFRNGAWMEADLSKARFTDCTFEQCDLSNAVIDGTGYRTVRFAGCKLLGNRFDRCNPFLLRLIPTAVHPREDVQRTINSFKEVKKKLEAGAYRAEKVATV